MSQRNSTVPLLVLEGVTKTFEGQRALDRLDLNLAPGEIHALLGQNGCGKSTLIKLLAGYHSPTSVERSELHGNPFELGSASQARAGGMHFIHQDLGLVPTLDTVDNLALGSHYSGRWWLSDRRERRSARELCERYGLSIDVRVPVGTLSPAQQTMIAIVRALRSGVEDRTLLVLDEPTAALPDHEVAHLFDLLNELRARGATVLYVTHRLAEVFQIADRVTVLRDGRRITTQPVAGLDYDTLLELIVGRPVEAFYPDTPDASAGDALVLKHIGGRAVRDVSLTVGRGETVGVTGLLGSGYDDLLRLTFDASERARGEVALNGREVTGGGVGGSIQNRIAYAPADRKRLSGIPSWTVRENLTLPALSTNGPARWLGTRSERADTGGWLQKLKVTPAEPDRLFSALSGGNQQKVVLARWLRCGSEAFLLEEPTNGVDIGARQAIYEALADAAKAGAAVLMSSSDAEELSAVCDRVVVLRNGVIGCELRGAELTVDRLRIECARDTATETDQTVSATRGVQ